MPQQRMDIRMIKDILRLKYQGGLSHDRIARSLSISKGAVAKYLSLAGAAGLDWASTAELDEAALERRLMGGGSALSRVVEPDYPRVHIELRRKGVTLMLLWAEYRAAHEGQRTWAYTQFCGHYKAFAKTLKRSMRQQATRRREALHRLRRTDPRAGRRITRAGLRCRHGGVELHIRLRDGGSEHALVARRDGPRADLLRRCAPGIASSRFLR